MTVETRTVEDFALESVYRRQRLLRALNTLNTPYQRLIVILVLLGYKPKEIAEVCGCSSQVVSQKFAKFRERNGIVFQARGAANEPASTIRHPVSATSELSAAR